MSFLASSRHTAIAGLAGLIVLVGLSASPKAESVIRMDVDSARLVKLSGEPSTVVLSNPLYADATIQGDRLILIGKNTGRTNVIVLDLDGNQLANFTIKVRRNENQMVSVYRAGRRSSLQCEPFCDEVLAVNDDAALFKQQVDQINGKSGVSGAGNAAQ